MKRLHSLLALSGRAAAALLASALTLHAQGGGLIDVGSDGADGDLVVAANVVIDLSLAETGTWNMAPSTPGRGIYDPEKWAVVFRYRSVTINSSRFVDFKNHPSRAPVVWLVEEDATIEGTVRLNGDTTSSTSQVATEPGPGGFRGGYGYDDGTVIRSGGFGPGGGARLGVNNSGGHASHGTLGAGAAGAGLPYGNPGLLPLLGGSGGGGGRLNVLSGLFTGGGGGGAILIAAGGTLTVNGSINADGGSGAGVTGHGSGGAIRLVGSRVEGDGSVLARASSGGDGIVRVDAFESTLRQSTPPYTQGLITGSVDIWPRPTSPRIRVTRVFSAEVGSLPVPADPRARFDGGPNADVMLHAETPVTVEIAAENVPLDWTVTVRIVPRLEDDFTVAASRVSGDAASSLWRAQFQPPSGIAAVQARADAP